MSNWPQVFRDVHIFSLFVTKKTLFKLMACACIYFWWRKASIKHILVIESDGSSQLFYTNIFNHKCLESYWRRFESQCRPRTWHLDRTNMLSILYKNLVKNMRNKMHHQIEKKERKKKKCSEGFCRSNWVQCSVAVIWSFY